MKLQHLHPWDVTPARAREIQQRLRGKVITRDALGEVRRVAGVDVGFEDRGKTTRAAVAVLAYPSLEPVEQSVARLPTRFPYVPGLLSFREIPAVLAALERIRQLPDLLLCDGQGLAHPRRFGIACHLGVLTDIPAIGVAKSRLVGEYAAVPEGRGEWTPLVDKGECIGAVVRTRAGVKPLFISPGHRIGLESAIDYVMACTPKYRLPETTRQAHRLASG
ncbi:MAG TPA: deoxyribonuclease V [Sedimenticola sp.]|nr:deoxyribonuclease V [Sedimenticola sp.]